MGKGRLGLFSCSIMETAFIFVNEQSTMSWEPHRPVDVLLASIAEVICYINLDHI